ncbi:transmembrane 9 superfamily member 2-like [Pollicipes pollicipes]|uniref:transmembrane 9 superfamily member 2-like n=1 Tax=Pollicipes pollicipes TaxID=41117 RepID=UPI0018858710|nr:transmembrane 9 superfamily member 2-like [Pollicipes pollicipes]XP_037075563.1 transmembrane 9 superfamily member 2-like [Pollicipes pollicipes]
MSRYIQLTLAVCVFIVQTDVSFSFYLPGLAPVNYCEKEKESERCKSKIPVFVNRLTSLESVIPYDYSYFDFCEPKEKSAPPPVENLGQVVFGQRIQSSPYEFLFEPAGRTPQTCVKVCERSYNSGDDKNNGKLTNLKRAIFLDYQHHFIVDNMPVTLCYMTDPGERSCNNGFPVGCYVDAQNRAKPSCYLGSNLAHKSDVYYVYNHLDFNITYHSGVNEAWGSSFQGNGGRIIRVQVTPRSIQHPADGVRCDGPQPAMEISGRDQLAGGAVRVQYTYSVTFHETHDLKWSSRWDYLLDSLPNANIQWFSILNSLVIVLFLSGMVAMIMLRTLHKDIARYNQIESGDDSQEEFGWKLVHGDVFRPPRHGMLLSVLVGSGVQVLSMMLITLVFACLGFLSPANRGSLMTCGLVLYVCLGTPAGYVAARIYKSFGGEKWGLNVLLTSTLCPGIVFSITLLLNFVLWAHGSSAALPFLTILALIGLWFGVSVPLTFVGAYFGFKKRVLEHPVRTNQIPRQIPEQSIYTRPVPCVLMGGILPFGCIFVQLFFILSSIWSSQMYYMFGFLFLVFVILVITCSETTILLCYFHLCAEDYHWWWRSFMTSGFTAFYLFIYCCHYFATKLSIVDPTSIFLYFGYTAIMVFLFFIMTGTIGYLACFWFVRKIYSVVKVD